MKDLRIIIASALLLVLASCEILDTDTNLTVAERLEGQWLVEEEDHLKSANEQFYRVYIDISPVDSNRIQISNFYGINGSILYANINGMVLDLPQQEISEGFRIYGAANISANYKQLTWRYYVDDGSGEWVQVDAIYTKEDTY